jgi:hypothetical protein
MGRRSGVFDEAAPRIRTKTSNLVSMQCKFRVILVPFPAVQITQRPLKPLGTIPLQALDLLQIAKAMAVAIKRRYFA